MSTYTDARDGIYSAYADTGLWVQAFVKQQGRPAVIVYVGYEQPTNQTYGMALSTQEHALKYRYQDLPLLAEGDSVKFLDDDGNVVKTRRFEVRSPPIVPVNAMDNSGDGYWRRALLTHIE